MKKIVYCLLVILGFNSSSWAQGLLTNPESDTKLEMQNVRDLPIIKHIEKMAKFKGDFNQLLFENLRYPDKAAKKNIQGKIFVKFVVYIDGTVDDFEYLNERLGGGLEEEAIRVMKLTSGRWEPGTEKGVAQNSIFIQPITFRID